MSSKFQRVMEQMFQGSQDLIIYIDDILASAETIEELIEKLKKVLTILNKWRLRLRIEI